MTFNSRGDDLNSVPTTSLLNSALAGMNAAQSQMLGAVSDLASGNLNNLVEDEVSMETAKIEFEASAESIAVQNQTVGSLLDVTA